MFPEGRFLEFALVAIVALVVVGPKDLPVLLRTLGRFMAKVRGMAAEFRASFDEMARQSELDELRKEVEAMRKGQIADMASSGGDETNAAFAEIHQGLTDVGVDLHPATSYPYASAQTADDVPVMTATAKPRIRKPSVKATAPEAAENASVPKAPAKAKRGAKPAMEPLAEAVVAPKLPAKPRTQKTINS